MKKINLILMLSCCLGPVMAQNWTGAVDSDWNNPANWSATPANGGDMVIDPSNYSGAMASPTIAASSAFTPNKIDVTNGGELTIEATIYTNGAVSVSGNGSILRINAPGFLAMTSTGLAGQFLVKNNATFELNSGNLTTAGQMVVDLGGEVFNSGGVIAVSEGLRLSDGNNNGSSSFYVNNGVCQIDGDLMFANTVGAYRPLFEQSGGIVDVSGSLSWNGSGSGAGRGYFQSSGGQITVHGGVMNVPGSTMNMDVELDGSVFFHMEGNAVTMYANDSIEMDNGASWIDENTVSWTNGGVLYASDAFYISGNSTINGNGYFQYANLSIPVGNQLVHNTTNAPLRISGDLTVNGAIFIGTDRKVIMNGSVTQMLGGMAASIPTFYHFEINNSGGGVMLETPIAITNNFELTQGIMTGNQTNSIHLVNSSQIIGGSLQSFVDGYIYKAGNHAFTFPLGDAPDRYRPLTITAPSGLSTVVGASYIYDNYAQLTPVELPMLSVSAFEYWDLTRSGSSDDFSVTVGWNDAAQSGLTNCEAITMAVWDGSEWRFVPSETTGLCSGNNAGTLQSITDLIDIGPLTFGLLEEPVGIFETASEGVKLYPNPLSNDGLLHVRSVDPVLNISFFAQDGRLVKTGIPETMTDGEQVFRFGQLEQGLYQVEMTTKSGKKYMQKVENSFVF